MNITYTGKEKDFTPEQQKKIDARFARLGKLVERKGEKKAHVVLKSTRHQHKAEITLNLHDHPLVGIGNHADGYHALLEASEKLEKQIHKLMEKRLSSTKRSPIAKRQFFRVMIFNRNWQNDSARKTFSIKKMAIMESPKPPAENSSPRL